MPALPKPATFGACLHPFSAGSFLLAETVHPPGCKLAQHSHARANLVVVLEGQFIETRGGRSFECGAHSGLFKTPGELHSSVYGTKGARCLLIEIDDRRSSALAADPGVLERV